MTTLTARTQNMRPQALGAGLLAGSQAALPPFTLYRPRSAREAIQIHRAEPDATLLAGAIDLVGQIRRGFTPASVIALSGVGAWRDVEDNGDVLRLGALTTHHSGPLDPVLRRRLPNLAVAWASIATVRIRARATLGGNLMARQPRYETSLMMSALDAELEFTGLDGEFRSTPAALWSDEPRVTGLLHHVRVPMSGLLLFDYERTLRPLLTLALSVRSGADGLRVTASVGSEYHPPVTVRAEADAGTLAGLDAERVAHELAGQLPESIGDYAASAAYRRRVSAVLLHRKLAAAGRKEVR
ncbi:FAD binding domain-containing protein [Streptomyces umbrinus]|uniref:FAD binding domain-containing protein n=1 Tax=Streptomyces umbrinus TaxID=67370 RepID=UPI0033CD42A5